MEKSIRRFDITWKCKDKIKIIFKLVDYFSLSVSLFIPILLYCHVKNSSPKNSR